MEEIYLFLTLLNQLCQNSLHTIIFKYNESVKEELEKESGEKMGEIVS